MALSLEQKKDAVLRFNRVAAESVALAIVDARGVSASQMTRFRQSAREQGVVLLLIKNTLARRALQDTDFSVVSDSLAGPSLFGFSRDDPAAVAKLFRDFGSQDSNFSVKALSFDGRLLAAGELNAIADLPSREQALAMLLGLMLAPLSGLARALNEIPARITRAVGAVGRSRDAETPAPKAEDTHESV